MASYRSRKRGLVKIGKKGAVVLAAAMAGAISASAWATQYTYTPPASNDSTNWSDAGDHFDVTPLSDAATEISFGDKGGTTAMTAVTATSDNDVTSNLGTNGGFQLATLDLGGLATNAGPTVISITGGDLEFDGAANSINLAGKTVTGGALSYSVGNNLILDSNLVVSGNGTAGFTFAGAISGGGASISKSGSSILTLSGVNTFSGGILLSAGTLVANNTAALGAGTLTLAGGKFTPGANGTYGNDINATNSTTVGVDFNGNTYTFGNLTISSGVTLTFSATSGVKNSGANFSGTTRIKGNVVLSVSNGGSGNVGTLTNSAVFNNITVDDSVATNTTSTVAFSNNASLSGHTRAESVTGVISDNATDPTKILALQVGGGSIQLTVSGASNTYTGPTMVNSGSLIISHLANGGSASGIGASSNAAGNLVLNGGTFQYSGSSAASTDRLFTLGGSASISASGSGSAALTFSNSGMISQSGSSVRTLTLTGTNTGTNTLTPVLTDNGANAVGLSKTAAGTWVLGGQNTYTGPTSVSGGTLSLGATGSLATTNISISAGTLTGSGTINSVINGATSQAIQLSGTGKLDITNLTLNVSLTDPTQTEYVLVNQAVGSSFITGNQFANVTGLTGPESISYTGTDANPGEIVLMVPEPASIGLLGFAGAGLLLRRRRKSVVSATA